MNHPTAFNSKLNKTKQYKYMYIHVQVVLTANIIVFQFVTAAEN